MTPNTISAETPSRERPGLKAAAILIVLAGMAAVALYVAINLPQRGQVAELTAAEAVARASAAFRANQLNLAGPYVLEAVRVDPENAWAQYMLGQTYERAGRRDDAVRAYRTAARLAPQDPAPHYNLALLLNAMGQPEAALAEAEAAVAAGMPAARFALAGAYWKLKRWDEAAATYERLLADQGRYPLDWFQAYLLYGDLQWERGLAGRAAELWRQARDLNPQHPGVHERLARVQ